MFDALVTWAGAVVCMFFAWVAWRAARRVSRTRATMRPRVPTMAVKADPALLQRQRTHVMEHNAGMIPSEACAKLGCPLAVGSVQTWKEER